MSETVTVTTAAPAQQPANGIVEGLAAIAVAVLAILGLTGTLNDILASVATIVVGAALVAIGAEIISRFSAEAAAAAGGGIGIEVLGGLVAIVLGILAILDVSRLILLAVAVVVVGASLLLGSRLGAAVGATREAALATASAQALVGAAGIALGILALAGSIGSQTQITLILVALLVYAGAILLSSAAITSRVVTMVRP